MVIRKSSVCCSQSFRCISGPPKKTRMTMQSERLSPEATGSKRGRYEQSADSLSDYMRLLLGALLDHNFNNPAGAVEKSSTCTMSTTPKWAATFLIVG